MERPRLGFELEYNFEEEKRTSPLQSSEESLMVYTEQLDIYTRGWVYHPGLAQYELTISPAWEQARSKPGNDLLESRSFLNGFSAEMRLLPYKPYSMKLYGHKLWSTINSSHVKQSKNESTVYGALLNLKSSFMPATLSYDHLEDRETGLNNRATDEDTVYLRVNFIKPRNTVLYASHRDRSETSRNTRTETEENTFSLNHILKPTAKKIRLSSYLLYEETLSTHLESERIQINETMSWQHRENLRTGYAFRYNSVDRYSKLSLTETQNRIKSGSFNLNHMLYENLTTNILAIVSETKLGGDNEKNYEASANFSYQREIPGGILDINVAQSVDVVDRSNTADSTTIFDEPVTLVNGAVTVLANENIDTDSIIVTNSTGLTTYLPGTDYTISEVGALTRITCVTGGDIDDPPALPGNLCATGASVLVTYQYNQRPTFDYYNYCHSYGVNVTFMNALSFYYFIAFNQQHFLKGVKPDILNKETLRKAGTELKLLSSTTNLDFENNDSTTLPLKSTRISERITLRPLNNLYLYFQAYYAYIKIEKTEVTETTNGVEVNAQVQLSRQRQLELTGFRKTESSDIKDTEDVGFSALYIHVWNIYQLEIDYAFYLQNNKQADDRIKNHSLLVTITRSLF